MSHHVHMSVHNPVGAGAAMELSHRNHHDKEEKKHKKADEEDEEEDPLEDEKMALLARAFDCDDDEDLLERVEMYVAIVEQLRAQTAVQAKRDVIDWAVAYAFTKGEWYGETLSTRLQNAMIVSALLLTVTASFFISPPELSEVSQRIFSYACGVSSLFFMFSIVFGIQFIENAMSRCYTESDRFNLIVKQYKFMNLSQVFSYIGGLSFPIFLIIPVYSNYVKTDAIILYVIMILGFLVLLAIQLLTQSQGGASQQDRIDVMQNLCDDNGQLHVDFYPKKAKWQPKNGVYEEYKNFKKIINSFASDAAALKAKLGKKK